MIGAEPTLRLLDVPSDLLQGRTQGTDHRMQPCCKSESGTEVGVDSFGRFRGEVCGVAVV